MKNFTKSIADATKPAYWQAYLDEWAETGLSKKKFCQAKKINYDRFIYWSGKLTRKSKSTNITPDFLPVQMTQEKPIQPKDNIVVNLPQEITIQMPASKTCNKILSTILQALL